MRRLEKRSSGPPLLTEVFDARFQKHSVTTPNRYFPIEPHALLPLYQFYPERLTPFVLRFSPGYMREVEDINLLSKRQMQYLFPEAEVVSLNLGSSLVAFYSRKRAKL